MSTLHSLREIVEDAVARFPDNRVCRACDAGTLTMADYHAILLMIFHQTYEGPGTFALAGAQCPPRFGRAREYLIHHADEEQSHYQWVLSDLAETGYAGPDPRGLFPRPACQAYIAFNVYVALRMPLARLAIAAVLEGIGARHGKAYAQRICRHLGLGPAQARFFYGHGDTDVGHSAAIWDILGDADLVAAEWAYLGHAAATAGLLYRAMYDEALA